MRISRIYIENFRNFKNLDLRLSEHAVIVGENKIGKSNLLHALRLVLDPSLPDALRQLRDEDFWDYLPRPLTKADRILVSVELSDFEEYDDQLAVLGDHLVKPKPMVARLTYVFQPRAGREGELRESDYEFFVYGGDRPENRVGHEVRWRIPLDVLPALRDAEGDLASWRRSPLRPLLDEAAARMDRGELRAIADGVSTATDRVAATAEIKALAKEITSRLEKMVGSSHAIETAFGFSPTDPDRLVRALRLLIDGGRRGINEASLGSANLLYLALKSLELEKLVERRERSHTFWAIEEPEAHLHPHLQRLVYREYLHERQAQAGSEKKERTPSLSRTVLLTTHSPHIVSVSPLRSLALLRKSEDRKSTEGVSAANVELTPAEEKDLERYLDVNRGEMLFAKGVLLVEGDAEVFLLPVLAKLNGVDFDELGITVCSVSGTNFAPYVRFLGAKGLNVPVAVVTDSDPDGTSPTPGQKRVLNLAMDMVGEKKAKPKAVDEFLELGRELGLFVNEHTFEIDLFKCGRHEEICDTLAELSDSKVAKGRAGAWRKSPGTVDGVQLVKDIVAIGKGRFAQRLATRLQGTKWPVYVKDAVEYVAKRRR